MSLYDHYLSSWACILSKALEIYFIGYVAMIIYRVLSLWFPCTVRGMVIKEQILVTPMKPKHTYCVPYPKLQTIIYIDINLHMVIFKGSVSNCIVCGSSPPLNEWAEYMIRYACIMVSSRLIYVTAYIPVHLSRIHHDIITLVLELSITLSLGT